jgi:recombination associated protein RdgC
MFFKNLRAYKITDLAGLSAENILAAVTQSKFAPCTGQEAIRMGFTNAMHKSSQTLCHALNDDVLVLTMRRQEKILPAKVINEELQPKIEALELEKGRPLGRKEKQALKEELIQTLIPRAFSQSSEVNAIIDKAAGYVFIDTSSAGRAEDLLSMLRKGLGSLPVLPWVDGARLSNAMQTWLAGENLPQGMALGHAVKLVAPDEEGAKASFDNQLLTATDVQNQLEDKMVVEMVLTIENNCTFKIKDNGTLTQIKWHDLITNGNDELGWDDLVLRLNADLLLIIDQLRSIVRAVLGSVGVPDNAIDSVTVTAHTPEAVSAAAPGDEANDPLYSSAVEFVKESRKASVSAVQRKLRIGYNRAARLIEQMEDDGIVSGPGHNGNREVIV